MKKYIAIPLVLSLMLFTTGCSEEFLELAPNEALPTAEAILTIDDLNSAMVGVYSGLQNANHYGRYFILVPDVMSDDVKQNASANRAKEYAEYEAFPEHFITQNVWARLYNTINRANTIINSTVEVTSILQPEKDQLVGAAYAIRALTHFDLVRLYGQHYGFTSDNGHLGVPIVTVFDQDAEPSRASVGEVYAQIISDLNQAISLMGDDFESNRMNKTAAQAILARVYLYMGDWANAQKFANDAINSGNVSLVDNAALVSTWRDGVVPDALFEIEFNAVDNNGSDALGRMYIAEGYGDYLPSADVVDLIPDGDVRGELFKADSANLGGAFGFIRVDKYPDLQGQDNVPVVRLPEVYMIRAEASYNLGEEDLARADVELIRKRALPSAESVTATGDELMREIELEKRLELMFEGHRLWDLMRWQRGVERNDCTAPAGSCMISYPNDRFVLPMPQNEIDANPNIEQNPGYQS